MALFLHTADWQIGRQFSSFDAEAAPHLAEARFAVVQRLARIATERQVDAVLVAGDVLDAQTVSDRTIRRLFHAMEGFRGPWLLIPGNHDAALAESVWTQAQRMCVVPANVHLLLQPEVTLFAAQGFAVLPAPLTQRHSYSDLSAWMDDAQTPEGLLRIGLAHGSVQGILHEGIDSTNPIAPTRCETARLDWLALGDWHGTKSIHERMAYSGTPEADRFHNNDAGNALLVAIDAPGAVPRVEKIATGAYVWKELVHSLRVASDVAAVEQALDALGATDVVRLQLAGQVDLAGQQRLDAAVARADARVRSLQCERTALALVPTDEDLAQLQADGYVGELLAELRAESATGGADSTAAAALALLAAALMPAGERA